MYMNCQAPMLWVVVESTPHYQDVTGVRPFWLFPLSFYPKQYVFNSSPTWRLSTLRQTKLNIYIQKDMTLLPPSLHFTSVNLAPADLHWIGSQSRKILKSTNIINNFSETFPLRRLRRDKSLVTQSSSTEHSLTVLLGTVPFAPKVIWLKVSLLTIPGFGGLWWWFTS